MTNSAEVPTRSPIDAGAAEHATHRIAGRHEPVIECFALLDHRTRERTIAAAGAPAGRYLSVERGTETLLIVLERPITHIGRGLIADVRLEDVQVSRRHAIIALRGDGARVLDDRSSNGTFLNGRPVTTAYLSDGDVLRFGRVVLRYVEIAPRRRAEPRLRMALGRRARRGVAESPADPYTARVS
ncbi:MAG: FHA domain-containing protein [Solirubrobacteraceae bacterium]